MYIGNLILLVLSIPLVGIFVKILRVRPAILAPITALITILGVYTINNSVFDIFVMIGFGILGYLMKKTGFEPGPLVLAFVLGSLMESSFRRSMLIFDGDPTGFVTRPISGTILAFLVLVIALPAAQDGAASPYARDPRALRAHSDATRPGSRRAMTVLIGYVPTPVGEAALDAGLAEAAAHGDDVVDPQQPAPRQHRRRQPGRPDDEARLVAAAAALGVTAARRPRRARRRHRRRLRVAPSRARTPGWS